MEFDSYGDRIGALYMHACCRCSTACTPLSGSSPPSTSTTTSSGTGEGPNSDEKYSWICMPCLCACSAWQASPLLLPFHIFLICPALPLLLFVQRLLFLMAYYQVSCAAKSVSVAKPLPVSCKIEEPDVFADVWRDD